MFDELPYKYNGIVYINDIPQPEPPKPVKVGLFTKIKNFMSWILFK